MVLLSFRLIIIRPTKSYTFSGSLGLMCNTATNVFFIIVVFYVSVIIKLTGTKNHSTNTNSQECYSYFFLIQKYTLFFTEKKYYLSNMRQFINSHILSNFCKGFGKENNSLSNPCRRKRMEHKGINKECRLSQDYTRVVLSLAGCNIFVIV